LKANHNYITLGELPTVAVTNIVKRTFESKSQQPIVSSFILAAVTNIVKRTFESKSQLSGYSVCIKIRCDKYCKKNF